MIDLKVKEYNDGEKEKWDTFVMEYSMNGTFLQTKNFLDYHNGRFQDASLILYKGNDTIVAVVPACTVAEGGRKVFSAHSGSTFGGIVIAENFYNIGHVEALIEVLESYVKQQNYDEVRLKCTSDIFSKQNNSLLYYFLFQKGYTPYDELSCCIDFRNYREDIAANFTSGRRRDYKYSLKNELAFRKITVFDEIARFYQILCENLQKFDAKPVHSLEELIELKERRLKGIVEFYGVYHTERMIAGSMVFLFKNQVFHTQYLAADQTYLKLFPMNFLDAKLIAAARERGFRYFSFGTSTQEHGTILNKHLAEFKEGFGTQYALNKTYVKKFKGGSEW